MLDTEPDISPPPSSPTVRRLLEWKKAGEPIALSINGRVELEVKDEGSFRLLLELADRLDLDQILRERIADFDRGDEGVSLEQAKEEARRKCGLSL